jgi:hypothetical protein
MRNRGPLSRILTFGLAVVAGVGAAAATIGQTSEASAAGSPTGNQTTSTQGATSEDSRYTGILAIALPDDSPIFSEGHKGALLVVYDGKAEAGSSYRLFSFSTQKNEDDNVTELPMTGAMLLRDGGTFSAEFKGPDGKTHKIISPAPHKGIPTTVDGIEMKRTSLKDPNAVKEIVSEATPLASTKAPAIKLYKPGLNRPGVN